MEHYKETAARNLARARQIIREADIEGAWRSIGAEVRQVGSVRTGLLAKHRDIDFHIYTDRLDPAQSFAAMARIAAHPEVVRIEYRNGIDTEERCIEWHAVWRGADGAEWQIDMIHILRGSRYDGWFERVADRIAVRLDDDERDAVLHIKCAVPDGVHAAGIEICRAVLEAGVRDYAGFEAWKRTHPDGETLEWMP